MSDVAPENAPGVTYEIRFAKSSLRHINFDRIVRLGKRCISKMVDGYLQSLQRRQPCKRVGEYTLNGVSTKASVCGHEQVASLHMYKLSHHHHTNSVISELRPEKTPDGSAEIELLLKYLLSDGSRSLLLRVRIQYGC